MQSLKKPPSGGFFYFSQRNTLIHSHIKPKNRAKKKHLVYSGAFLTQLGSLQSKNQLLQIHVQLYAAQGAAVPCSAATVAHATQ
jgi:hypothetical protein